ncbi:hypothetical protein ONZ45_g3304 [Pleurotus djamor]|nr:hypothetical protein ONZ45_g3304 [Pleurotus djamor]
MARTRNIPHAIARRRLLAAAAYFIHLIGVAAALYATPSYWKQPYHTSALSGHAWVQELIHGHPDRIWNELGMRLHVFVALVAELRVTCGLEDSRAVSLEEQLAIFLYTCVTGLSSRHVGERFQHSHTTINKYFSKILKALASPPFYTKYVRLPQIDDPTPAFIQDNPKFFPFFRGALGAMDGTHINCWTPMAERHASRNRKGSVSQNCLACCSFQPMRFQYMVSGWEGSAADGALYQDARLNDLPIPDGKYYLADAGFGICDHLLVPYRGARYHLAEWGRADIRPANKEELFNLRHAQARNVVERIFGVVKRRWDILNHAPEYPMEIQAQIPPALAAAHNFIDIHDPTDVSELEQTMDALALNGEEDVGEFADGPADRAERTRATEFRDKIAEEMWTSYQILLRERGEV